MPRREGAEGRREASLHTRLLQRLVGRLAREWLPPPICVMHIVECMLARPIGWRVDAGDAPAVPLKALPGFLLPNPLLYNALPRSRSWSERRDADILSNGAHAFVQTPTLLLAASDEARALLDNVEEFSARLDQFLSRLRLTSGQGPIPRTVSVTARSPNEVALPSSPPALPEVMRWAMAKYATEWAVTSRHVVEADATAADPVPTSHDLLLDAVQAALTDDPRRVLLYAAMAVEVFAGARLDAAYEDALNSPNPSTSLRVRDYKRGGGKTERSDAVFVALRSRDRFAYMLHELPLYVLGRSLAADDQALFQQALQLYRTRNKIAHTGQPPNEDQYLPTTRDGARRGLDAAFGVFKWFGDRGRLVNPLTPGLVRST